MAPSDPSRRGLSPEADGSPTPFAEAFFDLVVRRAYTRSEEPFVLSSGATSYDYIDLRKAVADGADLEIAARALIEHLDRLGIAYDAIGGMTMGADPFVHAVASVATDTLVFGAQGGEVPRLETTHRRSRSLRRTRRLARGHRVDGWFDPFRLRRRQ